MAIGCCGGIGSGPPILSEAEIEAAIGAIVVGWLFFAVLIAYWIKRKR